MPILYFSIIYLSEYFIQKFLEFIESAKDGVILFSFGTVVDSSKLPNTTLEVFINVFKKLKQKVIWKLNSTDFPQLPTHIMVDNWLPQSDILGKYNIILLSSVNYTFSFLTLLAAIYN